MAEQCLVREANQEDVNRVVELWGEHVDFHADCDPRFQRAEGSGGGFAEHLLSKLNKADYLLLVAEVAGKVVGFLNGQLLQYPPCFEHREFGFIDNLAVSEDWRHNGFGKALLDRAMEWFSAKGVPTVEGKVLLTNPMAMGFWQNTQFRPYMQTIRASTTQPG